LETQNPALQHLKEFELHMKSDAKRDANVVFQIP